ncbi:hypothetical protein VTL71DRAFT_826 [Oculimacula yallundae]|uniref:C2H2-type domain-containing protein n=1 Tax=Oculimacula yallundae TaxID=86028 RepID=A0ABR4D167_9HELO
MFVNEHIQYSNRMGGESFSSSHSANSSFSDGSSDVWDTSTVYTPMSTPRGGSPNEAKYQNSVFSIPTPTSSPDRNGAVNGFSAMNTFTQSMMATYHQPGFPEVPISNLTPNHAQPYFNTYAPYLNNSMVQSFVSNHGLPMNTPGLTNHDMFSPVSEISSSSEALENCVVPSQTTFDAFNLQSPMNPVKSLQFSIDYNFQNSDYDTCMLMNDSSPGRLGYVAPDYQPYRSEHSTPPRGPSHRQSFVQPQEYESPIEIRYEPEVDAKQDKKPRKSARRSQVYDRLSTSIGVNPKATFSCVWPGCKAKFARSEHQKRHHFTHVGEKEPCDFCGRLFATNRGDNLLTHVNLHAYPTKSSRTKHHPGAPAWIALRISKNRKRATSKVKDQGSKAPRITKVRS